MKVLIIGTGYIGSYVTQYLTQQGFSVTNCGNRSEDYDKLSVGFVSQFQYIIVLAGHSSVQMCAGPLQGPWDNNVRNMHNLIRKVRPDQNIIYASSASVYSGGPDPSVEIDMSLQFVNNYDLTKIALDNMVAAHAQNGATNLMGLRFGTVNGASPLIRRDLMLNSMVWSALQTGQIDMANGHIHRPILWIRDLGVALKLILTDRWVPGVYNVASFNSTVLDMALATQAWVGGHINSTGSHPGAYDFSINVSKFSHQYGFVPTGTPELICEELKAAYEAGTPTVKRDQYFNYKG